MDIVFIVAYVIMALVTAVIVYSNIQLPTDLEEHIIDLGAEHGCDDLLMSVVAGIVFPATWAIVLAMAITYVIHELIKGGKDSE